MHTSFNQLLIGDRFKFISPEDNKYNHEDGNWIKENSTHYRHETNKNIFCLSICKTSLLVSKIFHTIESEQDAIELLMERKNKLMGTNLVLRNFICDEDDSSVVTWYDRKSENYVTQKRDGNDMPIGDARFSASYTGSRLNQVDSVVEMRASYSCSN